MYFAAVIDWHSRAILSYKLSNTMDSSLAIEVLQDALDKYPALKIFNSYQGSQYTSIEHIKLLKKHNIQVSMNGKGRSIDNILIERFFRTLKYSEIYINDYQNMKELRAGIDSYMHKYNFLRPHSAIGYNKPMDVYVETLAKAA